MAKSDFFPKRIGDQRNWLETFKVQLPLVGPTLGVTPAELADLLAASDELIRAIDIVNLAENAYKQSVSDKDDAMQTNLSGVIRPAVKRLKTSPAYTTGQGDLLGVEGIVSGWDPDAFRPTLKAKVTVAGVTLTFVKGKADGVRIYSRTLGGSAPRPSEPAPAPMPAPADTAGTTASTAEAQFHPIAIDFFSPYVDNRPLARPGTPETREYYAVGILKDQEIGLPSDIIRATVS